MDDDSSIDAPIDDDPSGEPPSREDGSPPEPDAEPSEPGSDPPARPAPADPVLSLSDAYRRVIQNPARFKASGSTRSG